MNDQPHRPPRPRVPDTVCDVPGPCSQCTWKCQRALDNEAMADEICAFLAGAYAATPLKAAYREGTLDAQFPQAR